MAINSKKKGARGEVEFAHILREYGFEDARRGVQYNGADGSADVIGLPNIHCEIKRTQKLNIYNAMDQAINDAREGEIPAVFHRRNRDYWKVTLKLEDFMEIYKVWESHLQTK
jgi:hypothetical protein